MKQQTIAFHSLFVSNSAYSKCLFNNYEQVACMTNLVRDEFHAQWHDNPIGFYQYN